MTTALRNLFLSAVAFAVMGCDADASPPPGELLGPCPLDEWGEVDLCNDEHLACVPAGSADSNICLSTCSCAGYDDYISVEMGWGGVCYPTCETDDDCLSGQVCAPSVADGALMCAWPL